MQPTLSPQGTAFDRPPASIHALHPELHKYLTLLHTALFGAPGESQGRIGPDNIQGPLTTTAIAAPAGSVSPSGLTITTPAAGGSYNATVEALINEIRTKLPTLGITVDGAIKEVNAHAQTFNSWLAALRSAKVVP